MILAWTIGNLGGAYFGMQDEELEGSDRRGSNYDDEGQSSAFNIPINLVRIFIGGLLIAGVISIFIAPNEAVLDSLFRNLPKLLIIGLIYLLIELFPYIERFGSWLEESLRINIDLPSMPEVLSENGSQPISPSSGYSIAILVLLASVLAVLFFFFRYKRISGGQSKTEEDISSTADRAITELHDGEDVRDVIIRNYQKMLIILEQEGIKQKISFTPRELEKMALSNLPLTEKTIDEMTALFEEAKYSDHPLSEKERNRAIKNFKQIKEEIEGMKNA
ncbi:MAG: DUF4129 domain-containing protein [Candidatus Thermoplasmatota archaeon]